MREKKKLDKKDCCCRNSHCMCSGLFSGTACEQCNEPGVWYVRKRRF